MSTMNVSLPAELKAYVDERVAEGSYGTSSEYIRELIRTDQARRKLRTLIEEGLSSPPVGPPDKAFWTQLRRTKKRRA